MRIRVTPIAAIPLLLAALAIAAFAPGTARGDYQVGEVIETAKLTRPVDPRQRGGGRQGLHTEALGHMLPEMQFLQRAYPGLEW